MGAPLAIARIGYLQSKSLVLQTVDQSYDVGAWHGEPFETFNIDGNLSGVSAPAVMGIYTATGTKVVFCDFLVPLVQAEVCLPLNHLEGAVGNSLHDNALFPAQRAVAAVEADCRVIKLCSEMHQPTVATSSVYWHIRLPYLFNLRHINQTDLAAPDYPFYCAPGHPVAS